MKDILRRLFEMFFEEKKTSIKLNPVSKATFERSIFLNPSKKEIIEEQIKTNQRYEKEFKQQLINETALALNNLDVELILKNKVHNYNRRKIKYKSEVEYKQYENEIVRKIHRLLVKNTPPEPIWEQIIIKLSDLIDDEEYLFNKESSLRNTNAILKIKFKNLEATTILEHTLHLLEIFNKDMENSCMIIKKEHEYLYKTKPHCLIIAALLHDLAKSSVVSEKYSKDFDTDDEKISHVFHAQIGAFFFQEQIINNFIRKEYGNRIHTDAIVREVFNDLNEIKNAVATHHDSYKTSPLTLGLVELDSKARAFELEIHKGNTKK